MQRPVRDEDRPQAAARLFSWWITRLLLLVLGCGYALPAVHFATVAHEVCVEHGALEHVHPASEGENGDPSQTAAVSGAAAPSDEHECCGVLGISPPSGVVAGNALAAQLTLALAPADALGEAPASRNIALLSYAPKLAPPV